MAKSTYMWMVVAFLLISSVVFVLAKEVEAEPAPAIGKFEAEKLIGFINGILATILASVTFAAYKRDKRDRLIFVGLAFALFAVRSFLVGYELFFPEIRGIDPVTPILDFFVMLSFFYGVLKK